LATWGNEEMMKMLGGAKSEQNNTDREQKFPVGGKWNYLIDRVLRRFFTNFTVKQWGGVSIYAKGALVRAP